MQIPTTVVQIKATGQEVVINTADFDASVHVLPGELDQVDAIDEPEENVVEVDEAEGDEESEPEEQPKSRRARRSSKRKGA